MPLPTSTPPAEPVILLISRRWVESGSTDELMNELKLFSATREDTWRFRQMMAISVDGYNSDSRELMDIPEVRDFLRKLYHSWPTWAYFLNYKDGSIPLLLSSVMGAAFPGNGAVEIDITLLPEVLAQAFAGMNSQYDKHDFPEAQLELQSKEFLALINRLNGTT